MPLQPFQGFIGDYHERNPKYLNSEVCQNLYYESPAPGSNPRSQGALLSTPGLFANVNYGVPEFGHAAGIITVNVTGGPITYVIVTTSTTGKLYQLVPLGSPVARGAIFAPSFLVRVIASNQHILMFEPGSTYGSVWDLTNTSSPPQAISPDSTTIPGMTTLTNRAGYQTPIDGDFVDGYGVLAKKNSEIFFISRYQDLTNWDALDFTVENDAPDTITALRAASSRVWVFSTNRMVAWYNSGAAGFPFSRDNSSRLDVGCLNPHVLQKLDNTLYWIGRDPRGGLRAYTLDGYQPRVISTAAEESRWQTYKFTDSAYAFTYTAEGHSFYVLCFPDPFIVGIPENTNAGECYVYDSKEQRWHTRVLTENVSGVLKDRLPVPNTATYNQLLGGTIVGDRRSCQFFVMDRSFSTDAGVSVNRIRVAPHITNVGGRMKHERFWLDTNTTVAKLSYSDDYGTTYNTARTSDLLGQSHLEWKRLGSSTVDRVYKVQVNDDTQPTILSGAYVDVAGGAS
jgi:hypothetical protein